MNSINPDNRNHAELEDEVRDYLMSIGYMTSEATYHSVMPKSISNRLSRIFTTTALYIRGRADRIAVHKSMNLVFEWEAKSHTNPRYRDIAVEMLPLVHHISRAKLGVRCLYVHRDVHINQDCGFWVHELPDIREVHFVNGKLSNRVEAFLKRIAIQYFPSVKIRNLRYNGGSGDPYVLIDSSVVSNLPHWKVLIDEYTTGDDR